MKIPNGAIAAAILVLALLAAACAAPAAPPTPTPGAKPAPSATIAAAPSPTPVAKAAPPTPTVKPATVKVGTLGAASDAAIYIGQEKGYFRQEDLIIEVIPFSGVPLMTAPLSTGELDVGAGTLAASLLNAIERGVSLKIVADKSAVSDQFLYGSLVIRKDLADGGAIKTPKDLKGRKIGLSSVQSGVEANVAFILESGGLTIKDVDLVNIGYPDTIAGLANKALDAGYLIEPFQTQAVERGVAVLWEPGYHHRYTGGVTQGAVVVYSEAFVKNVDVGRRFMVAYLKGVRDYIDAFVKGKNKVEVVSVLVKNTTMKDPAMYDKVNMTYINPNGRVDIQSMKMTLDYFKKMGYYTGKLGIEDIIDNQFADYAVSKLGKYQ